VVSGGAHRCPLPTRLSSALLLCIMYTPARLRRQPRVDYVSSTNAISVNWNWNQNCNKYFTANTKPNQKKFFIHAYGVVRFSAACLFVCLSVFHTISQKSIQLYDQQTRHRNVPPWVLESHLFWVHRSRSRGTNTVPTWVFALLWVLVFAGFLQFSVILPTSIVCIFAVNVATFTALR